MAEALEQVDSDEEDGGSEEDADEVEGKADDADDQGRFKLRVASGVLDVGPNAPQLLPCRIGYAMDRAASRQEGSLSWCT